MASRFAAVGTPEPTLSTSAEPVTEDTSEPESESTSAPSTSIASVSEVTPECQDPLYTYVLMGSVWRLHAHASVRRRCITPTEFQEAMESLLVIPYKLKTEHTKLQTDSQRLR